MPDQPVLLLHGFASSGKSAKAKYLRKKFEDRSGVRFIPFDFNPTPTDFKYMTISGMIDRLRQFILNQELSDVSLIGSSLGGLVALHYASRYGGKRLLLLAPLLAYRSMGMGEEVLAWWEEQGYIEIDHYGFPGKIPLGHGFHRDGLRYQERIDPAVPTRIIHGRNDRQVPVEHSRSYVDTHPNLVEYIEVASDHSLADQYDFVWDEIQSFLLDEA
jgi:hypothetical protein